MESLTNPMTDQPTTTPFASLLGFVQERTPEQNAPDPLPNETQN